jgi:hypothetical protein
MICPPTPPADGDDLYDFAPPEARAAPTHTAATSAAAARAPTPSSPLQYQNPRDRGVTEPGSEYFPDKTIDYHLPLALIAGGTLIEVVAALYRGSHSRAGFAPYLTDVGLGLVVGTATKLVAILIAARFRGIELGKLPTAIMKLAAISIAPGAAFTLLTPALAVIPFGILLGFAGQFILYFALLGTLFHLDESDTWYCVCVIFVINVALYFALMAIR